MTRVFPFRRLAGAGLLEVRKMSLFKPDNFARDWYGELTNQMSHALLGVFFASALCLSYDWAMGEMPYRAVILPILILPYLLFEIVAHGWKAGDSWFDSLMYSCGALAPLVTFDEIEPGVLATDPVAFFAVSGFWVCALALRIKKRVDAN